jgi:hypothetical protein
MEFQKSHLFLKVNEVTEIVEILYFQLQNVTNYLFAPTSIQTTESGSIFVIPQIGHNFQIEQPTELHVHHGNQRRMFSIGSLASLGTSHSIELSSSINSTDFSYSPLYSRRNSLSTGEEELSVVSENLGYVENTLNLELDLSCVTVELCDDNDELLNVQASNWFGTMNLTSTLVVVSNRFDM